MSRSSFIVVVSCIAFLVASCGGSGRGASSTATAPPAPTATAPAAFSAAKLQPALMSLARVNELIGTQIQTQRDKTTDPQLPFSSVPAMGNTLVAQQVSLLYNSFQTSVAPAQGMPYNVQNTTQGYPTVANATSAFAALRTAWTGNLFQNLQAQDGLGASWQESFCQLGNFASTTGQISQWYVCMARSTNYIVTVSIGALPGMNVTTVSGVVRAYFAEALRAVQ